MPIIENRHIGIAFDLYGCPNACRHCWLGPSRPDRPTTSDMRRIASELREWTCAGDDSPSLARIRVASWLWEPDYRDDYRELYALERELCVGEYERYELISAWRVAHDPSYAPWLAEVGPRRGQLTLFGMEETTDWFVRRKGSFREVLTATERLLENGLIPRWEFFLTRRILPELDELMRLVDRLHLRERVAELGEEFVVCMHAPDPIGRSRDIEHLRPEMGELGVIPADLVESTKKHFGRDIFTSERELRASIREDGHGPACGPGELLWLFVTGGMDVYSNIGSLESWWRIGNLRTDSLNTIMHKLENNEALALSLNYGMDARDLLDQHGDDDSMRAYSSRHEILAKYLEDHCQQEWNTNR
jgi:MoaA/NifB/PqqE/SkfB family radical SAM enzyme